SFFLRDVFMNVVFPDQTLATRTEAELRRLRMRRMAVAAVAAVFALTLLIPSIIRFINNRDLVKRTASISNNAAGLNWGDAAIPAGERVDKLDALRGHVELLLKNKNEGPPLPLGFPMYQGDTLYKPARDQYVQSLRTGFVRPTKEALAEKLAKATGAN